VTTSATKMFIWSDRWQAHATDADFMDYWSRLPNDQHGIIVEVQVSDGTMMTTITEEVSDFQQVIRELGGLVEVDPRCKQVIRARLLPANPVCVGCVTAALALVSATEIGNASR